MTSVVLIDTDDTNHDDYDYDDDDEAYTGLTCVTQFLNFKCSTNRFINSFFTFRGFPWFLDFY
jgi:hypothetical protein